MAIPNIKDFILYINKKLTGNDWNTNWQKLVNLFTSGQADVKFKSVEISQDGGLVNNGSLTQNGNLTVGGNAEITGNLQVNGTLTGDGSGLTGVISAAQISYTPFCVNSGNLDSDGMGDLFLYTEDVSTNIQFKVSEPTGTYKPITFTNAKGKTVTLNAINSYDLSQTDNGTYIVYITENATAITLSDNGRTIFRQPYAPTVAQDPQPSDIWLDTSSQGLTSYLRQSGTWVEANIVPLGTVTVANHTVHSAETFIFNVNGYNVNIGDCPSLQANQYPKVIVSSYFDNTTKSGYMIYSNGWIEQFGRKIFDSVQYQAGFTVNLLKEMKDTEYSVYITCGRDDNNAVAFGVGYKVPTTTDLEIQILQAGSADYCKYVNWKVEGYIKEANI